MNICCFCGTEFSLHDGLFICRNGHVSDQHIEVVENEFYGRKASSSLKVGNDTHVCRDFSHLGILFGVYRQYERKFGFENYIMKIFLQNIRFQGITIIKSESFISGNLLVLVLYLALRCQHRNGKIYMISHFNNDICDLNANILRHKSKIKCKRRNNLCIRKKVTMLFLRTQFSKLDINHRSNKYMIYALKINPVSFIKYFIHLAEHFQHVYDLKRDEDTVIETLNFQDFSPDQQEMIESLLEIREHGLDESFDAVTDDNRLSSILSTNNYQVDIHIGQDVGFCAFFINAFIKRIHGLRTLDEQRETVVNYFLKFVLSRVLSDDCYLFFYELEVCSFLYVYICKMRKSTVDLAKVLTFMLRYLDCSEQFFLTEVYKVSKFMR